MAHNKNKMQDCGYSGQVLDFVYDELTNTAKNAFETHLAACEICSDEVAALSSSSLAVREWRSAAFDPLVTPRFSAPTASQSTPGIFAIILGLFRQPVYAAAAATLLVGSAIGLYFLLNGNASQPQVVRSVDTPAVPAATSTAQVAEPAPAEEARSTIAKEQMPAAKAVSDRSTRPQGVQRSRIMRKMSAPSQSGVVATNTSPQKAVPEELFGEIPETRDRSLRLTDLFAEDDED